MNGEIWNGIFGLYEYKRSPCAQIFLNWAVTANNFAAAFH